MLFLIMKVLKCLWVMEDVDIGLLGPATVYLVNAEFIIVVMMVEVYLRINRTATLSIELVEFIVLLLTIEVKLGLNRPANIPPKIMEQELMLTGEVYIGLRPATISPITQAAMADCLVHHFLLVLLKNSDEKL